MLREFRSRCYFREIEPGRANQILNGPDSRAVVLVEADFKRGSFVVDLRVVQEIVGQAMKLIEDYPYASALTLAVILGLIIPNKNVRDSLFGLIKSLKGEKPAKVTPIAGNNFELTLGQNKKTVIGPVMHLYGDSAVREALRQFTRPLQEETIERMTVKQDGKEQTVIEKSEAPYFEPEPIQLLAAEMATEGERDTVLTVSKLSFKENATWTFFEQGATVYAKIEDEKFWTDVHHHRLVFGEGDFLRVRLKWKIERKKKLIQVNTITKVYELVERPKQLTFER